VPARRQERGFPTPEQLDARRKALDTALKELAAAQRIARLETAEAREEVIAELQMARPAMVRAEELHIAAGGDPDARESSWPLSADDLALLVIPDSRRAVIVRTAITEIERWESDGGRPTEDANELHLIALENIRVAFADLTENEKRSARRVRKRWSTDRWVFREGKPPYRYAQLVETYIDLIEELTGHPFQFSGSTERRNGARVPPRGPEFRLLVAALDLALFASGPPRPEMIASIVRQRRKRGISSSER
jgi:hypothetical protein